MRFFVKVFVNSALFPAKRLEFFNDSIIMAAERLKSRNDDSIAKKGMINLARFVPQVDLHRTSILVLKDQAMQLMTPSC